MRLIDINELSELLSIKPKTVYSWVKKGKIPYLKINGLLRFHLDEIVAWMKQKGNIKRRIGFIWN